MGLRKGHEAIQYYQVLPGSQENLNHSYAEFIKWSSSALNLEESIACFRDIRMESSNIEADQTLCEYQAGLILI